MARILDFDAVLFDLDGVLTPTALVHRRAWAAMFDDYLAARDGDGFDPFTDADYFAHVDGKPRYDGVRDFLAARAIALPEGGPDDEPTLDTVHGLGNRKNDAFAAILRADGVEPYAGSVRLLDEVMSAGRAVAVVSSSRNAVPVLTAAGLADRFEVIVDGVVAAADGIAGKPAPDTFLEAARRLGVAPARAVVVEDAISGVEAGRDGDFGLVVGVDREGQREALAAHGADVVVDDLAELLDHDDAGDGDGTGGSDGLGDEAD